MFKPFVCCTASLLLDTFAHAQDYTEANLSKAEVTVVEAAWQEQCAFFHTAETTIISVT
jgi:hypothetical protein